MTTAAGDALPHVDSLPLHKSDFGTPGHDRSAPRRSGELPCVIFPDVGQMFCVPGHRTHARSKGTPVASHSIIALLDKITTAESNDFGFRYMKLFQ
jgi:hypothetical protein